MRVRGFTRGALSLSLLVLLVAAATADVVHLKDGGKLEGKIVAQDSGSVTIQTRFGKQKVPRSRIREVEVKATPAEELAEREKDCDPTDADALFELASFAQEHKLRKDYKRLLAATLKVDPSHAGANQAEGRVRHGDRWVTPEQRRELESQAREAQMREKGLVPHQGRWVTPEEKANLEGGKVLVDGEWLSEDEAMRARGLQPFHGGWASADEIPVLERSRAFAEKAGVRLVDVRRDHTVVSTNLGEDFGKQLALDCEKALELSRAALRRPEGLGWLGGQKVWVVALATSEEFSAFCEFFAEGEKNVDQRWARSVAQSDGFYWFDPTGISVTFKGPRNLEQVRGRSVHQVGHVHLNRYEYNHKFLPPWIDEAYAALTEFEVMGDNTTSCLSTTVYGSDKIRDPALPPNGAWREALILQLKGRSDPSIRQLARRDYATLETADVAKGMGLVEFWKGERGEAFLAFLDRLRRHYPDGRPTATGPDVRQAHEEAYRAFGDGANATTIDEELRSAHAER